MQVLRPVPLTKTAFAHFGDVLESEGANHFPINRGFAERYNDLAHVEVGAEHGLVNIALVEAQARAHPIAITMMERHPLGSQIFFPLQDRPWLVLVCGDPQDRASYRAFTASGRQGVNYARGVWHHPLLGLEDGQRFLVVDRKGPGHNLDEAALEPGLTLTP